MNKWMKVCTRAAQTLAGIIGLAAPAMAADIYVGAGGSLQAAIDAAQPGDRILLEPGATYSGNFVLRDKGSSDQYITILSAASGTVLPPDGVRVTPADAPNLARIQSPNTLAALRTAPGAHHWRLQWLEFGPNDRGYHEIISLGAGDSTQTSLADVPHHLVLDRLYVHGDPIIGQKRGIGLNSGATWIVNSYVADIKAAGMDTQAIAGWNGPGPWVVSNNYLEATGENVLVGGADPRITNLVPSDLEFSRNHLNKPASWRGAILQTPGGVTASAGTGGSLAAGTYSYRVVALLKTAQDATSYSARSVEVTATVAGGGRVSLAWNAVPHAQSYRVYRGTAAGAQDRYFTTGTPSFTDSGASSGTADTGNWIGSGSRWTVKNLFELKSAQRVLVDGNVMEHNWLQAQNGYAILFTPRNQDGSAPWTVVRDVTFTNNIVRHSGSAVNILGYDYLAPSQQTRGIVMRNNLFYDISGPNWGGDGRFVLMGDEPRDIVIDHNTVVQTNTIIYAYGGGSSPRQILGVVVTNNLFRHNAYGILGEGRGIGNDTIDAFMPDAVVLRNTFAGGNSWQYPANNEFPSVSVWQSQFVDYAGSDFHVVAGSPYVGTATDGTSLGADIDAVLARTSVALSGRESGDPGAIPVAVVTSALPAAAAQAPYAAQLAATGGSGGYVWALQAGTLPPGLALDRATGVIGGVPAATGLYAFTVSAADFTDPSNAAFRELQISVAGAAPLVTLTSPAAGETVTGTSVEFQASATDADGLVTRVDFFAGPTLVATSTAAPWAATWGNASPGGYELRAVATDNDGLSSACDPVAITVLGDEPPPPSPPPPAARPEGEIVLWADDVTRFAGLWTKAADATAAGGVKLTSPDGGWNSMIGTSVDLPHASPANFFEAAFDAPAGVAYQVWLRMRAIGNGKSNDSVFVQFSDAVTAAGAPLYRAGTTDGLLVNLEACNGCGSGAWGWRDGSHWIAASAVRFPHGGTHVVRVQIREDGVEVDQIVLTPVSAAAPAPGPLRDDATILAASAKPSSDVVLYASDFAPSDIHGHWSQASSSSSPEGVSLQSPDGRWATPQPLASPEHYADVTFAAAAGTPYRVWVRLNAAKNSTDNDAVWLQFTDAVSGSSPVYRIGTTGGFGVAADGKPINWVWAGGAPGLVQSETVTFAWSGLHRLRVQTWEDGVQIDQIVLSPVRYRDEAPGSQKNDATIVAKP